MLGNGWPVDHSYASVSTLAARLQISSSSETGVSTFSSFLPHLPILRWLFDRVSLASANRPASQLDRIEVVHGTTVGTNALLQRRGARIALITTKGFEDVLVIGRQARPELYNLNAIKPPPLVADELRLGISERVVASGEVLEPLDERELSALVKKLKRAGVEAVAISLLFSFLHPEHEERIASALASLNVPLSISSRILPEYREYERTSTVVINAYLQPLMGRYLKRLSETGTAKAQSARDAIIRRQHLCRCGSNGAGADDSCPGLPVASSVLCARPKRPVFKM